MSPIKASIIIPVYNAEPYLRECLDSIINQNYKSFEIICVDDGSTDNSLEILNKYSNKIKRMLVLKQKNKGAGAARNTGIMHAKGEYLLFVDSDDRCKRNLLKTVIEKAETENADIVCFDYEKIDPNGDVRYFQGYQRSPIPIGAKVFNYETCPDHILSIINPTPWNKLFKRAFVQENNLRYEEISSTNDITFAAVSCACAKRIAYIDKVLYQYRIGHGNTITSTKTKRLGNVITAVESTVRQVRMLPYYERIKRSVQRFVIENYIFSLDHYATDITSRDAGEFINFLHKRFAESDLELEEGIFDEDSIVLSKYNMLKAVDYDRIVQASRKRLVVSLTSFPARINSVRKSLDTIYCQTKKPDEVVLWLAKDEYPNRDRDLPSNLIELINEKRLSIRWCDNLKPHKKYYYAFQEFPEDLIITIDDDLLHQPDMIERLYISYIMHPNAVSAMRTHVIMTDETDLLPYEYWLKEFNGKVEKPSMQLLCTGGAGALYPVELFKALHVDQQAILEHCLSADDIWLKLMEAALGIPVAPVKGYGGLKYVPGTQKQALYQVNIYKNDEQLVSSMTWFEERYGKGFFINALNNVKQKDNLIRPAILCPIYTQRINKYWDAWCTVSDSRSYRIGRMITYPVRIIRSLYWKLKNKLRA